MKINNIILPLASCVAIGMVIGCSGSNSGVSGLGGTNGGATGGGSMMVGLWTTTSVQSAGTWTQSDRLARPVVNEVFATVAGGRHADNDHIEPFQDKMYLQNDIQTFMDTVFTFAGKKRSQATVDVIKAVLVPDEMKANLSQGGKAAYLGVETKGATGGTFGGRALTDDVVDTSLGIVFGNTISKLGLAADDGAEVPTLTSDNVGSGGKHFTSTFPFLGAPR
jgi:hypothetical protein